MPRFTANPKGAAYCPLVPDSNSDCKLLIPCYLSVVVYRAYGVAAILLYNSYKYVAPNGVISCIAHGGDFLIKVWPPLPISQFPLVALRVRRSLRQSIITGWSQVHYIEQFSGSLNRR
jgi:hypothetical protein